MKNMNPLIVLLILFPVTSFGATWKEKCTDFKSCVESYSELTGEQYLYEKESIKGAIEITGNLPFVKEESDLIFTNILYQNGLARVMIKSNVYNILRLNDAKSKDVPLIKCDQNTAPKIPNSYDLVTMQYRMTNPSVVKESENVIRTYADMGARIYGVETSGLLLITDVAKHMDKIYQILTSLDVKPTADTLARMKARESARLKAIESGSENRRHEDRPSMPGLGKDRKPGNPDPR